VYLLLRKLLFPKLDFQQCDMPESAKKRRLPKFTLSLYPDPIIFQVLTTDRHGGAPRRSLCEKPGAIDHYARHDELNHNE